MTIAAKCGAKNVIIIYYSYAHSSAGIIEDLGSGGRWFVPRLDQYSFQELMIFIAPRFIHPSTLSIISTTVMWESIQWLGQNIVRSTGYKNSRKAWIGVLARAI